MKNRRCPVCNKVLTQGEYVKALGIVGKIEDCHKHEVEALQSKLKGTKQQIDRARQDGIALERHQHRGGFSHLTIS